MYCDCGSRTSCIDTRYMGDQTVKRRHACHSCGARFTTVEKPKVTKGTHRKSPLTMAESETLQRLMDKLMVIATGEI